MPAKMDSQVCQNYHRDCEAAVNRMVNMEMFASAIVWGPLLYA
uniref:Uncharacterized protein n=1 Tax=Acanthochromis polyacanthus TaxID=80966 RepID=A0A3Q1EV96_9TELE